MKIRYTPEQQQLSDVLQMLVVARASEELIKEFSQRLADSIHQGLQLPHILFSTEEEALRLIANDKLRLSVEHVEGCKQCSKVADLFDAPKARKVMCREGIQRAEEMGTAAVAFTTAVENNRKQEAAAAGE